MFIGFNQAGKIQLQWIKMNSMKKKKNLSEKEMRVQNYVNKYHKIYTIYECYKWFKNQGYLDYDSISLIIKSIKDEYEKSDLEYTLYESQIYGDLANCV